MKARKAPSFSDPGLWQNLRRSPGSRAAEDRGEWRGRARGDRERRIVELTRQIAEIDDAVGNVIQAADPAAERAAFDRRRNALGAALSASQAGLAHATDELSGAAARLEASETALTKALSDLDEARATASEALRAAGFADAAAPIQAELSGAAQEQLSKEFEPYRSDYAAVLSIR
jgi:hypothetical protein